MRRLMLAMVFAATVSIAGVAIAGGTAVVLLSSTPSGVKPGEPWNVDIKVLQHGITPVPDAKPTITIENEATGESRTFSALPTSEEGVYRARVVIPSEGEWKYEVYDGFETYGGARTHRFPAVGIRTESAPGPSAATRGERPSLLAWLLLAAAGLLLMTAVVLGTRRMRTTGAA